MKLAIITGADGGMGYEEAKAVAQKGYHTIMACYCPKLAMAKCKKRNRNRLAKKILKSVSIKMIEETGNPNIEVLGLNLADLASVRRFADEVKSRFERLDLLMNNAGTIATGYEITVDGLERTVSVNYVGPYLLTRLLLPLMGQGSRIVNMASCVYRLGALDFPEFFERGRKGCFQRIHIYSNTKLAITLFTFELADRLRERGITVNAADPGVVSTGIIRMQMFFDPLTDIFFRPFIRTPRQGADTAIRLLLDEDKVGQTGTFSRSNRVKDLGEKYQHHRQRKELWERTEEIVKEYL